MSENRLFSINGAADLLERDRQTLVRALRTVPADGHDKAGHPKWKMATIVQAMSASSGSTASPRMTALADALEETGAEVTAALEKLRSISDIAKRRRLAEGGLCQCIGKLNEMFEACEQSLRPQERDLWAITTDVAMRQAIGEIMSLCDFRIRPEDLRESE
jgi:hypothetical protein